MRKLIIILFVLFAFTPLAYAGDCAISDYSCAQVEVLLDYINAYGATIGAAEVDADMATQAELEAVAGLVDTDDELIAIINASPSTQIAVPAGGTGAATFALNGVLYGTGATAIGATAIGTAGQVLTVGADPFVPVFATPREFSKLDLTEDTTLTEAQVRTYKYISNQGDAGEAEFVLPDLAYVISVTFIVEEVQNLVVQPAVGELLYLNNTALDADDCVDSDSLVGSMITAINHQDADGDWNWHLHTVYGAWTDAGDCDP